MDWSIVVSDIKGSTQAVQNGKYREVNIGGASVIALVSEKMATRDFPFIFGGDGATLLLPNTTIETLRADFAHLIYKIKKDFQLELRIGIVPYSKIQSDGYIVSLGKLKRSSANSLAQLTGSGIDYAEKLVKTKTEFLIPESSSDGEAALSQLSCRFAPIRSRNGKMLTLTVKPTISTDTKEFTALIETLGSFFSDKKYRPLSAGDLRMDSFYKVLSKELKIQGHSFKTFKSVLIIWCVVQIGKIFSLGEISAVVDTYLNNVVENSDYVKFDGCLRLVIDCSESDIQFILSELEKYQTQGVIDYGHHISDNAVTTCVVDEIRDQKHVHFIDGEGGGYTRAASVLKKRKQSQIAV